MFQVKQKISQFSVGFAYVPEQAPALEKNNDTEEYNGKNTFFNVQKMGNKERIDAYQNDPENNDGQKSVKDHIF